VTESTVNWDSVSEEAEFTGNAMPRTRAARTTGASRGRRVSDKRLQALEEKLSTEMFTAGSMIGLGVPVTGYYICQESDNFCHAVVTLAAKNSNWVAALENIAMVGPGIQVGRTVLGIGAALASDRYYRTRGESGLDPERRSAMFLGVSAAYYAVHPPEGVNYAANGANGGFQPPPNPNFNPLS
jgi:hypothetical protein